MSKKPVTAGAHLTRLLSAAAERVRRLSHRRGFRPARLGRTIDPLEYGRIPLDLASIVPARPDFLGRCRALAERLVVARDGERRAIPWDDGAVLVLTAFIAFVACDPDAAHRNLMTVRRLISSPEIYNRAVEAMQQVREFRGDVARQGQMLRWFAGPDLSLVIAAALRHTAWLDDQGVPPS
jgi:hypothetical protein